MKVSEKSVVGGDAGDSGDPTRLTGKRYLGGCGGTRRRVWGVDNARAPCNES